jgi:hypothetical protein
MLCLASFVVEGARPLICIYWFAYLLANLI